MQRSLLHTRVDCDSLVSDITPFGVQNMMPIASRGRFLLGQGQKTPVQDQSQIWGKLCLTQNKESITETSPARTTSLALNNKPTTGRWTSSWRQNPLCNTGIQRQVKYDGEQEHWGKLSGIQRPTLRGSKKQKPDLNLRVRKHYRWQTISTRH